MTSTTDPEELAAQHLGRWDRLQLQWLIRPETDLTGRLHAAATSLLDN